MSSATLETIQTMLQSLPAPAQERAIEHLREYLREISDEIAWDESFARTQNSLADAARHAMTEFKQGSTEPLDLDRL